MPALPWAVTPWSVDASPLIQLWEGGKTLFRVHPSVDLWGTELVHIRQVRRLTSLLFSNSYVESLRSPPLGTISLF